MGNSRHNMPRRAGTAQPLCSRGGSDEGSGTPRPLQASCTRGGKQHKPPREKINNIWGAPGTEEMLGCPGGYQVT